MINIGDKVKIKYFDKYPSHWLISMKKLSGKIVTIKHVDKLYNEYYITDYPDWYWKETDFKKIFIFKLFNDDLFKI